MAFFQMMYAEEEKYSPAGVAYGPEDAGLFVVPRSGVPVDRWRLLELALRDGEFTDYLANDMGVRLCSERLRACIEEVRRERDAVQWLEAGVSDTRQTRQYHVLHFPIDYPVVNESKSIMAGPVVVKPVLLASGVRNRDIFALPNAPGRTLFVSETLKDAILEANCTGMGFTKVSVYG